jgi:hypothetical protein
LSFIAIDCEDLQRATTSITVVAPKPKRLSRSVGKSIGRISYINVKKGSTSHPAESILPDLYPNNATVSKTPDIIHVAGEKRFPEKSDTGKNTIPLKIEIIVGRKQSVIESPVQLLLINLLSPQKEATSNIIPEKMPIQTPLYCPIAIPPTIEKIGTKNIEQQLRIPFAILAPRISSLPCI